MLEPKMNMQIKLISYLLNYPDESMIKWIPIFREVLGEIKDASGHDKYDQILSYFEQTPLIQLQEQYTERGPALVHLEETYLKAGFQRIGSELPDFLPLMLEFISERPDAARSEIMPLYGEVVETLAGRLGRAGHPYVLLFEQLSDILGLSEVAP
jgi:nitrate reductase delta subunit